MIDPSATPYEQLAQAIADHLLTVPGLRASIYPPTDYVEHAETPAAIVYLGSGNAESRIDMDMDGDSNTHFPSVMVSVMVPRKGDTAKEFARVDALIWPICKAFNDMTAVNAEPAFKPLPFHVDKCRIPRWRGARLYTYGDTRYYGADFYFDIKFHG